MQIDAYDNPINMGQGVPFQNDSDQLLINLPAEQMSLNLDNKREFFDWYQAQSKFKFSNPEYLPRFVFGHYMKAFVDKINNANANVTLIKEEVVKCLLNQISVRRMCYIMSVHQMIWSIARPMTLSF